MRALLRIPERPGRVASPRGDRWQSPAGHRADSCHSRHRRTRALEARSRSAPGDIHVAVGQCDRLRPGRADGRSFDHRDDPAEHLPPALSARRREPRRGPSLGFTEFVALPGPRDTVTTAGWFTAKNCGNAVTGPPVSRAAPRMASGAGYATRSRGKRPTRRHVRLTAYPKPPHRFRPGGAVGGTACMTVSVTRLSR